MMVGDSCDNLLANYRIFFEGMPDPVFYKYFYPTGDNTGVLWDLYHYGPRLCRAAHLKRCVPRDHR